MPQVDLQSKAQSPQFQHNGTYVLEETWPEIESSATTPVSLSRRDHVLHELWGLGRVTDAGTGTDGETTISFADGRRIVKNCSLRRLLPRTQVAHLIEKSTPNVTAWMVRKADKQGTIVPDVKARFAGHAVHYYDAVRIPLLIDQLSAQDSWSIGTLVVHSEHGPGSVIGRGTGGSQSESLRLVQFFGTPTSISLLVGVQRLRRLLSSSTVAERLGVNRKTFGKLAKSRGVFPDYVIPNCRWQDFYDEARIEDIRKRWFSSESHDFYPRGCLVIDGQGEIARVESSVFGPTLLVRYLDADGAFASLAPTSVQRLVSFRELARKERISRYKLNRLLTSAGIRPAHQDSRTIYFDASSASEAITDRLGRESSAMNIATLAKHTGISARVLAAKVRQGCIRTIGGAAHSVDLCEAGRIKEVVKALQTPASNLQTLGVCKLQLRGCAGQEVVAWNIAQLSKAAQHLTPQQQVGLFEQVGWLCCGAGRHRFVESLQSFLLSSFKVTKSEAELVRGVHVLRALLRHLPAEFERYCSQLTFLASGAPQLYGTTKIIQSLARRAGLQGAGAYDRFHAQINESVSDLLTRECNELRVATSTRMPGNNDCFYPEDEFKRGAVVVCVDDQKPEVGFILRVEQQSWNAVSRRWDKTVVVRFNDGERRLNPRSRTVQVQQRQGGFMVLLSASEVGTLLHHMGAQPEGTKKLSSESLERIAS